MGALEVLEGWGALTTAAGGACTQTNALPQCHDQQGGLSAVVGTSIVRLHGEDSTDGCVILPCVSCLPSCRLHHGWRL
jgi:hypothetical protein